MDMRNTKTFKFTGRTSERNFFLSLTTPATSMVVLAVQTAISPVQSFKRLLKSPTSLPMRRASPATQELPRLPANILYEIARHLDLRDVLQLGLCSHRTQTLVSPLLYHTIDLKSTNQCKITLLALSKRPATERSVHVKRLVVRPNNPEWSGDPSGDTDSATMQFEEERIAKLVGVLGRKGHLVSLDTFEWDGLEMPGPDMWDALRISCRNLKRISTSIGEEPLDASSPLWDFNDLRHVGIHVKCHSLDWLADGIPQHKTSKLPRKFWAMLLERSPRLESLTLGGPAPAPRILDVRHFTAGRWPRLRELVLGDVAVMGPSSSSGVGSDSGRRSRPGSRGSMEGGPSAAAASITSTSFRESNSELQSLRDQASFMAFFMAHPTLQTIKLLHAPSSTVFPSGWAFPVLGPVPPPTSFPGSAGTPSYPPSSFPLHPRHLSHPPVAPSMHHTPPAQQPYLHPLPHLRSFTAPLKWVRTLLPPTRRGIKRLTITGLGMGMGTGGASVVRNAVALLREMSFGSGLGGVDVEEGGLEALGLWGDLSAAGLGGLVGGLNGGGRGRRMSVGGGTGGRGAEETDEGLSVVAALMRAVPGVREVDVVCFTRVGFGVRDFVPIIQDLPLLHSFSLTKVHRSGDEDLLRAATRIVQAHRAANGTGTLKRVYFRETYGAWFSATGGRVKTRGVYELVAQPQSHLQQYEDRCQQQPVLVVNEWGVRSRGLAVAVAVGAKEYRRCYIRSLPAIPASEGQEGAKLHRRRASEASSSGTRTGMRGLSLTRVMSPRSSISSGSGSVAGSAPFGGVLQRSPSSVNFSSHTHSQNHNHGNSNSNSKPILGRSGSDASTSESGAAGSSSMSASTPPSAAGSGSSVARHGSGYSNSTSGSGRESVDVHQRPASRNGHRHSSSASSVGKGMRAFLSRRTSWMRPGGLSDVHVGGNEKAVERGRAEEVDDGFVLV
ncbi:unnamed protein product [Cyclocybe aegerita]|uniref:F-box domain-containing protein n=1 Tax=Cyclocybe aegerita TaxID=1973307 RepID=A0A8S0VXJ3_CYCAE|nr:unnamed protein product [Cyclocybe aegerita]